MQGYILTCSIFKERTLESALFSVPQKASPEGTSEDTSEQNKELVSQLVSQLVSWCFKPSQPQRITSGLNKNFTLSQSQPFHKSSYNKVRVLSLFIFRGHPTWEPASSRVTYFILRAYTGTMRQPQPTQGKIGRGFGKNAGKWTGKCRNKQERKKSLAVSVACMAIY